MMNGFMPFAGSSSSLKSGVSAPLQPVPFQAMSLRAGFHGLPLGSHEARLYITRRFAGHDHAQFRVWPMPVGSELSRRAMRLPVGPQQPAKIQQPQAVLPSSRSSPKPAICSPALRMTFAASLGSVTSLSALPLYSFASSSGVGLLGRIYGQASLTTGSGNVPPSFRYSPRIRVNSSAMISISLRASPGGDAP